MTQGVLLYCFDTPETAYSRIADRCIALVGEHLGLPVTVVTDGNTRNNIRSHCDFKTIEIEKNNTKLAKPWYNLERHLAYEHSPYDQTIVMDVDYFCFSDKLLKLLDTDHDFLIHQRAHDITGRNTMRYDRESMLDLVWATVLIFRKTDRVRAIFETVKMIKQHYAHFCNLYRISYRNFRNDYAFAIALNQINGHRDYAVIPDSIATVPVDVKILEIDSDGAVLEFDNKRFSISNQDLHIINKEVANV
jgi:hypothetical protein